MIATIQRNENEYMTVDLSKVKDDDLIEECNERQISVYDDEMMALFEAIYHAKANNQCYSELVSKLIDKTLGRIL
jgi:phage-related baseplate assembly protein